LLQRSHSRRRRMESASLLSRESITLSWVNAQYGHFIVPDFSKWRRELALV